MNEWYARSCRVVRSRARRQCAWCQRCRVATCREHHCSCQGTDRAGSTRYSLNTHTQNTQNVGYNKLPHSFPTVFSIATFITFHASYFSLITTAEISSWTDLKAWNSTDHDCVSGCRLNKRVSTPDSRNVCLRRYSSDTFVHIWPWHFYLWPWKPFQQSNSHEDYICGKFHWNPFTKYIASREIGVNGRTDSGRTENICLRRLLLADA